MFSDTMLGATEDAVIIYLKNPSNQAIYEQIKQLTYPEMIKRKSTETSKY